MTAHAPRKRNVVPVALTLGNLLCGAAALTCALSGAPLWQPAALVGLALLFDLFDGRAARALGVDGPFGAQLDSLADVISFGLTPALTLHLWKLNEAGPLGLLATGALIAAAALRLARFTAAAQSGTPAVPKKGPARFVGLAVTIPATIGLGAAAADVAVSPTVAAAVALGLAALMISPVPYRSFKDRPVMALLGVATALIAVAVGLTGQVVAGVGLAAALGGLAYAASGPLAHLNRCAGAAR